MIKPETKSREKQAFFSDLSKELFCNVRQLYEQVDAQFSDRTPDESVGAQIAAFCVYSCGLFSTYICKYPHSKSQVLASVPWRSLTRLRRSLPRHGSGPGRPSHAPAHHHDPSGV